MLRALLVLLTLSAAPAAWAERPADHLARLRGTPSTNTGALGSAFPQQYVDAYRFTPCRPAFVPVPPGHGVGVVTCPAPGWPSTTLSATISTTTVHATVSVSGGSPGVVLAPVGGGTCGTAPHPTRRVLRSASMATSPGPQP